MTRKVVGWVAEYLGLAGFALLLRFASEDDRHFIIAIVDRATGLAFCVTALGVGAVLLSRPHERRAVPLIILATVLSDGCGAPFAWTGGDWPLARSGIRSGCASSSSCGTN
jgi:hypothetical protein